MLITLHPDNPQPRELSRVIELLKQDGVIIIPTDTVYAFACDAHNLKAIEQICRIKGIKSEKANFSLLCKDLKNLSEYTAHFERNVYRLVNQSLPGPYTFIFKANSNVPKIFKNSRKKEIGIRVPDNPIVQALLEQFGHPLVATSLHGNDSFEDYLIEPEEMEEKFGHMVAAVIDGGLGGIVPSTVIDCSGDEPLLVREGKGEVIL
ncbi:MAG TPA: L-threonylcarbamoyladenylate synthase [Bacteroidia bacterium]|nr:L-threonylcarbamoyladenylate synthase [Bacteroidia bacterium]